MEDLREQVYEMTTRFTADAHDMIDRIALAAKVGVDVTQLRSFVVNASDNYINLIKTAARITGKDILVADAIALHEEFVPLAQKVDYTLEDDVKLLKIHFATLGEAAMMLIA